MSHDHVSYLVTELLYMVTELLVVVASKFHTHTRRVMRLLPII
jgi:hypothetical protein